MILTRVCELCGKEFTLKHSNQNRRTICYDNHYYYCPYCNRQFVLSEQQCRHLVRYPNRKYFCSLSCASNYGNHTRNMDTVIKKMNKTCMKRYGVVGYNNRNKFKETEQQFDIWGKSHQTKKRNHSYAKSKQEEILYGYLKRHSEYDIQRQITLQGMSFDFKVDNILIEVNGSFYHNYRPYTDSIANKKEYKQMQSKGGVIKTVSDTWRYRDVQKLKYCKENKIPLLVIYCNKIESHCNRIVEVLKDIDGIVILQLVEKDNIKYNLEELTYIDKWR